MAFKRFSDNQLKRMMFDEDSQDYKEPKVNVFWPNGTTSEHRLEFTRHYAQWVPVLIVPVNVRGLEMETKVRAEDVELREEDLVRAMLEE
jgi:hypothetical protein